jgi:hypothetical protein
MLMIGWSIAIIVRFASWVAGQRIEVLGKLLSQIGDAEWRFLHRWRRQLRPTEAGRSAARWYPSDLHGMASFFHYGSANVRMKAAGTLSRNSGGT